MYLSDCVCVCVTLFFLEGGDHVYMCHEEQTRKLQLVKQQKVAEKKPLTLDNQSSLLAIYNVLHYITIPLACWHLHIPVTSLQRLLIINGSHMLPGAPYYRMITATQKAKKNGNYADMKWSTKTINSSGVIDNISQCHTILVQLQVNLQTYFSGVLHMYEHMKHFTEGRRNGLWTYTCITLFWYFCPLLQKQTLHRLCTAISQLDIE